jgi:signal transduction histidine kinase
VKGKYNRVAWVALLVAYCGMARPASAQGLVDSLLALPYNDMVRDLPASERALRTALAEAMRSNRRYAIGHLHRSLSIVTGLAGQLDTATHHSLRAVEHFRATGDRRMEGLMLCDLGHGTKRRDLDRAFAYYRQGLPILEALDAREDLTRAYNNFSMLYEMRGDIDSALFYGRKGLALKEELKDSIGLPYGLNRVALYLLHKQRFHEAQALMLRADSIRRIKNDVHGLAEQLLYFGDLYQSWGRVPEAIEAFSRAVQVAREVQVPYMEQYAQERLAELYELQGDAPNALAATRRAYAIKDSLLNERNSRTIIELEQRYAVAEKDRAIAELRAETQRRQLLIWLSLAASGLVLAGGGLWYQVKQRRLRAERDAAIIAERDAGLKAVFDATENERRRLAAELHDGIGQQLGGLKHRLERLKDRNGLDGPMQEVIHIVDDTSREVRELAHQMMPKALQRLGLVPALDDMLRRSFHASGIQVTFDHFGIGDDLRPELATGLYRIAQELVANILKHAAATRVDVQLMRNRDHLVLMVQDNGRGFQAPAPGGIGLRNITDRARALGGTFTISGTPGHGSEASVRLPVHSTLPA